MGCGPKPPSAKKAVQAQQQSSEHTASYEAALNRVNQVTPFGNSTYKQTGTDASGAPIYTQTESIAPELQPALQSEFSNINALGKAGEALQPQLMSALSQSLPDFQKSYDNAYQGIYDRGSQTLDPQWMQRQSDLTSQLANQGVTEGSDAWSRAFDNLSRERGTDYAGLRDQALSGAGSEQQRVIGNAIALRQEPLNEMQSLMSGGQVNMPQFGSATPINVQPANAQQATTDQYNAKTSLTNSLISGAGNLAGMGAMGFGSGMK